MLKDVCLNQGVAYIFLIKDSIFSCEFMGFSQVGMYTLKIKRRSDAYAYAPKHGKSTFQPRCVLKTMFRCVRIWYALRTQFFTFLQCSSSNGKEILLFFQFFCIYLLIFDFQARKMIPCDAASITKAENEKMKFVGLLRDAELAASQAKNEEDQRERKS